MSHRFCIPKPDRTYCGGLFLSNLAEGQVLKVAVFLSYLAVGQALKPLQEAGWDSRQDQAKIIFPSQSDSDE